MSAAWLRLGSNKRSLLVIRWRHRARTRARGSSNSNTRGVHRIEPTRQPPTWLAYKRMASRHLQRVGELEVLSSNGLSRSLVQVAVVAIQSAVDSSAANAHVALAAPDTPPQPAIVVSRYVAVTASSAAGERRHLV